MGGGGGAARRRGEATAWAAGCTDWNVPSSSLVVTAAPSQTDSVHSLNAHTPTNPLVSDQTVPVSGTEKASNKREAESNK